MSKVLIIDDMQARHEHYNKVYAAWDRHHAMDYAEAVKLLDSNNYDLIHWDHDLGENQKTGADIARYMADNAMKVDNSIIHSQNQPGAKNIASILKSGDVCISIQFKPFGFPKGMTWGP